MAWVVQRKLVQGASLCPGWSQLVARHLSTQIPKVQVADIEDANRELDDFFGLAHAQQHDQPAKPRESGPLMSMMMKGVLADSTPDETSPSKHGLDRLHPSHQSPSSGFATLGISDIEEHPRLTHVDGTGKASMVDVGHKAATTREARAGCRVHLGPAAFAQVAANAVSKGDVLGVARVAGIMAAKQTSALIPLCHNIPISKVDVAVELRPESYSVDITASCRCTGATGIEMEAMTAAAVAGLTVYDMCKAVSKDIVISNLQLLYKSGGKSGVYERNTP